MSGSTIEEAINAVIASSGPAGARSIAEAMRGWIESSPTIKVVLPKRMREKQPPRQTQR